VLRPGFEPGSRPRKGYPISFLMKYPNPWPLD